MAKIHPVSSTCNNSAITHSGALLICRPLETGSRLSKQCSQLLEITKARYRLLRDCEYLVHVTVETGLFVYLT